MATAVILETTALGADALRHTALQLPPIAVHRVTYSTAARTVRKLDPSTRRLTIIADGTKLYAKLGDEDVVCTVDDVTAGFDSFQPANTMVSFDIDPNAGGWVSLYDGSS